jgi:hypothetical protein
MAAITITDAGKNMMRDATSGAQNPKITYVALGTSSATPAAGDTQLGAEVFRKAVTSYTNGSTGVIVISIYLSPTDAVGISIQEVGFFGGNATKTANSGTLLAHGLYAHTHIGTESIQFPLTFTIS